MKKTILSITMCIMLILSLTACSDDSELAVEPATANAVINGNGYATLGQDADGNSIIQNLADGNYAEWIIDIKGDKVYSLEMEYASENEEFSCTAELYSSDGKLNAKANLSLEGTGSGSEFKTITEEIGELTEGMYTFIIRPKNMETKEIHIRTVKLT